MNRRLIIGTDIGNAVDDLWTLAIWAQRERD